LIHSLFDAVSMLCYQTCFYAMFRSFRHASPYLWNQLPSSTNLILFTLLLIHRILLISHRHSQSPP